jgi:2-keto-4-pentenoate hydratase/2-oxohepta-3-ene-1,7-dioic acid hydratase in catechol pathway
LGALQHPDEPIFIPQKLASEQVDFEAELAVVIGRDCKNATRETALDFVLGYTCANDVSARDWQIQHGGTQWNRGKSFDSFCPLGPVLTLKDEIPDPNTLAISTVLNGETMQNSNTADMIFDVPAIIEFLSSDSTLRAGTVILTGTPEGVGMARDPKVWLRDGDQLSVEIEKIGVLSNPVKGAVSVAESGR